MGWEFVMALGFGIVGCGMIADFHARAIGDVQGAKLVACQSRSWRSAEQLAGRHGCRAYRGLEEMLSDSEIDVVSITTPSGAHMEPAVAAARAGKHVVIEKPLEITLSRCDKIIEACKKNRVKLSVIFQSRFHLSTEDIRRAIELKRFGKLTMGDAYVKWYRKQDYYDSGAWRGTWELDGGGALMNQAIHSVDLLLHLMGPVAEVQAQAAMLGHKRIAVEDTAVATLRFKNGALGVIQASTATWPGSLKRIEIRGTQGSVVMEEEDITMWEFARGNRQDVVVRRRMKRRESGGGGASDPAAISHHGHVAQFRDVLNAIHRRRKPAIDGREGRRSVEVILAIYKAAKTGRTVKLPLGSR